MSPRGWRRGRRVRVGRRRGRTGRSRRSSSSPRPAGAATPARGRVLVISLPATEWADFDHATTPNLDRLFAQSAVGAMVTNGVDRPTSLPSGYVTLGAGARAVGNSSTGGQGFGVDEPFGRDPAGDVFTTRTGIPAGNGLVYMPITETIDSNDSELYGAKVGLLGDELARAGIARGVVANGDGSDPSTPETRSSPWRRAAVAALMTSDGKVPRGKVDPALLQPDAAAPFGVRLDPDRVVRAFNDAWTARFGGVGRGLRPRTRRPRVALRIGRAGDPDPRPRAGGDRPHRRAAARTHRPLRHGDGARAEPAEQPRRLERRVRARHPASRPVSSVPPRRNATASSTSPTWRRPCSPTSVSSAPTTWRVAGWRPATRAAHSRRAPSSSSTSTRTVCSATASSVRRWVWSSASRAG